jgi:DNA-binding LacI/PurR family transcriptional regulator
MEEFAAACGVSRPTVSKYFNNPASVKKSTRAKIEAAIERFNYRPNIFAINQNRRLTKNIGIIVPYLTDPFFGELARNVEQRCIDLGFSPLLFSPYGDRELEKEILDSLRSFKPAGVLFAPLRRTSDRKAVESFCKDVPTVFFDSEIDGVGEAFVGSDNAQSIGLIVDYLCRVADPPCFFEMRTPVNPNAYKRHAAYVAAMERLGHAPRVVAVEGDTWSFERIGYQEGLNLLSRDGFPSDTVLCSNDRLAIGLIAAACERGRVVGHASGASLKIAGHDDHPFSRYTCPSLTTVTQEYAAIAERSVAALLEVIEAGGRLGSRDTTLFEGRLVMRNSA